MLQDLGWPDLCTISSEMSLFHKSYAMALEISPYFIPNNYQSRVHHQPCDVYPQARTNT